MSLGGLLDRQHQLLESLLALLRGEQDLLLQPEIDGAGLSAAAAAKQDLLDALARLEASRRLGLVKLGYGEDSGSAEQAARAFDCLPLWLQIQDVSQRANHLNLLNGALIQQRLDHNQRALAVLRDLAGNPLYGVDGQSRREARLSCKA
ncbi:MAG: flagellar protein FlgN [Porticoccaceae bacterium]